MQDVQLSPGDPIFWLHHTYLDKLWWQWQARDLGSRLTDMTGTNMPIAMSFTFGPPPNGTAGGSGTGASLPFDLSCYAGRPSPFGPPPNGTTGPWTISIKAMTPIPELYEHFNDGGNVTTLNHTLVSNSRFCLYPSLASPEGFQYDTGEQRKALQSHHA